MWSYEINAVLWACRTTPHKATKETQFSMAYGIEDVIPAVIKVTSLRRDLYPDSPELNEEMLRDRLDLIEEK